jgi:hypothetical protein
MNIAEPEGVADRLLERLAGRIHRPIKVDTGWSRASSDRGNRKPPVQARARRSRAHSNTAALQIHWVQGSPLPPAAQAIISLRYFHRHFLDRGFRRWVRRTLTPKPPSPEGMGKGNTRTQSRHPIPLAPFPEWKGGTDEKPQV